VTFTLSEVEVAANSTATFTLQVDTSALLDVATEMGVDNPLAVSMDLGSVSRGTAIPGGFIWNDSNASVYWLGALGSKLLEGNYMVY
jgi:hypothetical protein